MSEKREKMVAAPKESAAAEPAEQPAAPERRHFTTLGELGAQLPIGVSTPARLVRDLAFRPWKTKDERELAKLKKPKTNLAQYVNLVLSHMFTKVGPYEFNDEMKSEERRLKIGQMYMADVFYMYVWLRANVIGEKLHMNITCPRPACGERFPWTGNLNTIEVYTAEREEDLVSTYKLVHPLDIRRKKVTHLRLGPAVWNSMESTNLTNRNEVEAKIVAIRGSVVGLNDDPTPIKMIDQDIEELSKADFEGLVNVINQDHFGPKMALEGNCPECGGQFASAIDWSYDNFFSISSQ